LSCGYLPRWVVRRVPQLSQDATRWEVNYASWLGVYAGPVIEHLASLVVLRNTERRPT